MKSYEQTIVFDILFVVFLGALGASVGGPSISQLSSLPAPTLAPTPGAIHCSIYDIGCFGATLANATAYIGWAIVNLPVLLGFLIVNVLTLATIALNIAFSPQIGVNGIPVIGLLFVAIQFPLFFEVFRMFRGSSTSGF